MKSMRTLGFCGIMKALLPWGFGGISYACLMAASIACAEPGVRCDNPYGTTSHLTRTGYDDREGLCAKQASVGAKWMRMDFDWRALQDPHTGKWDFSRYDEIMRTAESNGVQVVAILNAPPDAMARVWEHLEEWSGFVRTVATHYRGRIPVYEVWNEEDSEGHWHFPPDAANYLKILRAANDALKGVDSGIRVALGSLTDKGLPFCEELYELGASRWFDIMNVHPYPVYHRPDNPVPEGDLDVWLNELKRIMGKYEDGDKEIWITEIGWTSPSDGHHVANGLLRDALKIINPDRPRWTALVVDECFKADVRTVDHPVLELVRNEMPKGSLVVGVSFRRLGEALERERPDALVVTPKGQSYPSGMERDIVRFAESGGVVVEYSGMPFYKAVGTSAPSMSPAELRKALRIDAHNWWDTDAPQMPKQIKVHPTAAAKSVVAPKGGFKASRFVTDRFIGSGDVFVPLLTATWTNGVECVAAAAIRYATGGGVVYCGLHDGYTPAFAPEEQATYLPRTHLIAFNLGVSCVMWYELRAHDFDWAAKRKPDHGWGILHSDLTEKPAWKTYRTLIAKRPAGSERLPVDPSLTRRGIWNSKWRHPSGRLSGALWTVGGPRTEELELVPGDLRFSDQVGREIEVQRKDGKWLVPVSDKVIYFEQ